MRPSASLRMPDAWGLPVPDTLMKAIEQLQGKGKDT